MYTAEKKLQNAPESTLLLCRARLSRAVIHQIKWLVWINTIRLE